MTGRGFSETTFRDVRLDLKVWNLFNLFLLEALALRLSQSRFGSYRDDGYLGSRLPWFASMEGQC